MLIMLWPIMAHPPIPPKKPVMRLAVPCPRHSRVLFPRVSVNSSIRVRVIRVRVMVRVRARVKVRLGCSGLAAVPDSVRVRVRDGVALVAQLSYNLGGTSGSVSNRVTAQWYGWPANTPTP